MIDVPPLIDVIIPIYNAKKTVEQSINSVLSQTIESFRIFVIDDGSTDGSADVILRMAERDRRIVMLTKRNSGIVDALNVGLSRATAEFVARLDGDDLCDPDRFERQLDYLAKHADCVAVSSNARLIDEAGDAIGGATDFGHVEDADPQYAPSKEPYLSHPFLFLRRAAIEEIGGYRHVFHAEDVDLYWRLQHVGRIHGLTAVHGSYRVHRGSITSKSILNARIAAVTAQLAAISEMRRRMGRPDISFPADRIGQYQRAGRFAAIVALASEGLTHKERSYLAIASAAKLLDWTRNRPFELDRRDCGFIRTAIARNFDSITPENMRELQNEQRAALYRLFDKKAFLQFFALIDRKTILSYVLKKIR